MSSCKQPDLDLSVLGLRRVYGGSRFLKISTYTNIQVYIYIYISYRYNIPTSSKFSKWDAKNKNNNLVQI